ncbi:ArsR/SmtB family transcription factor [Prosthecodimorpha staleyi]|uniref:ArsR family transcriptional regulator n=2 Tax=Prosthecodimorpha staleyi TaxID=2840188 RepID=A0A947D555_9HYPH|nr:helix-turn-helix transcriptional regulator [Prosthecodimorpha staleyi]MBT9291031.1 ArsR family transcriptional regulator [Prosthecodimorpha staleyi]
MDQEQTILALAALAQPTRLDTFRMLVASAPAPIPAGELARRLAVPHNTMSAHLAVLARAGLVTAERRSRSILYRAEIPQLRAALGFLLDDCCGGHPELCGLLTTTPSSCCTPETADG